MAREPKNHFEITAYYAGNTCIIDPKHRYATGEVLCKLLNRTDAKIVTARDDLKELLQLLLFKLDQNYAAWEDYDQNVYKAQKHLNFDVPPVK